MALQHLRKNIRCIEHSLFGNALRSLSTSPPSPEETGTVHIQHSKAGKRRMASPVVIDLVQGDIRNPTYCFSHLNADNNKINK